MQAYEIAYSPDETRVALGWPGGRVAVHHVEPDDGSPGEEICVVDRHAGTIVHLAWIDDASLVSASVDGGWVVSDASSGEVRHHGSVGGEYVRASSSPDGASLFLFTYDGDAKAHRVRTVDGSQDEGPEVDDHLGVTARVFALDADVALYHFISDDYETDETVEGFVHVDFAKKTATKKTFERGPSSDFDEGTRLMAIDPIRRIGVRPDYGPVPLEGAGDEARAALYVELFDVDSLEAKARRRVVAWPQKMMRDGPEEAVVDPDADPESEEYAEARDWFVRKLCNGAFVRDADDVWITVAHGVARRVPLEGETTSAIVIHGGGPDTGPPSLDDIFARNLVNNHTLGVSASGAYVGYGNPNDFFSTKTTDLESETHVKLPMRKDAGAAEAPGCIRFAGSHLVFFDRGEGMHFADAASGEPGKRVELPQWYGEARDVSLSPDGKELVIAVAAGNSLVYLVEQDEVAELPVPPHGVFARHLDHRFVVAHYAGAVVLFDPEKESVECLRVAWEEGEEPERDFMAFEQRDNGRGATAYRVDGVWHVALLDEDGDVQSYVIDGDEPSVGKSYRARAWRAAGGDGFIAFATENDEVRIMEVPSGDTLQTFELERTIGIFVGGETGSLYAIERGGSLWALGLDGSRDLRASLPAQLVGATIDEALDRIAVVTSMGTTELYTLKGEHVATLALQPSDAKTRELVRLGDAE